MNYHRLKTPIGDLRMLSNGAALVAIEWPGQHTDSSGENDTLDDVLRQAVEQLQAYFDGRRTHFELPLDPQGTPFQHSVWDALRRIPYGEHRAYRDIAQEIGRPRAVRAVGAANGRNPLPIVVPCHRVIGSNGSLTGFAGGLEAKRRLLSLEGAQLDLTG